MGSVAASRGDREPGPTNDDLTDKSNRPEEQEGKVWRAS